MRAARPYDRQPGEPRRAFSAFSVFLLVPERQRSTDRAYTIFRLTRETGKEPGEIPHPLKEATKCWKTWKREWNWDARAAAHDAEIAEQMRLANVDAILGMNKRHADIALAIQGKVIEKLNALTPRDISASALGALFEAATKIERLARGEPTEILSLPRERALEIFALVAQSIARHVTDKQAVLAIANDMRGLLGESGAAA